MTPAQIAEITRRARQDAQALKSGWPVRGCPFQDQAEADLYIEIFDAAMKEGKK